MRADSDSAWSDRPREKPALPVQFFEKERPNQLWQCDFKGPPHPRPQRLPELEYAPGSVLRTVSGGGDISWKGCRIQVGAGIAGERVRVDERDGEIAIFYAWKQIRCLAHNQLRKDTVL